jgi:hypothetical protein
MLRKEIQAALEAAAAISNHKEFMPSLLYK